MSMQVKRSRPGPGGCDGPLIISEIVTLPDDAVPLSPVVTDWSVSVTHGDTEFRHGGSTAGLGPMAVLCSLMVACGEDAYHDETRLWVVP